MAQNKPLMLKHFLELDCDTVPRLLDAELQRGRSQLPRTCSESARSRISSVIKMLPFAITAGWLLSRSLSKRMRIDFWRNRGKSSLEAEAVDGERLRSCSLPLPPGVSRCSSWSFMSDSGFNSDETKNGSGRKAAGDDVSDAATKKATRDGEGKESAESHSSSEEEKEQLSPVSVIEFPSEGEEDALSPSFRHILLKLRRKKRQLLRRIGRFGRLAEPTRINLDRCFASCNDEVMTARRLLRHFTSICHVSSLDASLEKLLLDFFVHSLTVRQRKAAKTEEDEEARRLILAAREWMEGRWSGADDYHGEGTVREMEEGENGWMKQQAAAEEVAVDLEGLLFGLLMQELMVDLASYVLM
ncbi:uncharacterized protein LOC121983160 isoform X1 [Zingiber officinale]|uniref:uncharacterized protein LOC121983160 isoform X1 n=1 Tax=Zingiber officinale TaxID=94328 RepID=UPI001C4C4512|nr:uncharacterized protein LOC121983160 isoform X1 [Zingiber officinale]